MTLSGIHSPSQPGHNGFVESFHNRTRDELYEDNIENLAHAAFSCNNGHGRTMNAARTPLWATSDRDSMRKNGKNKTRPTLKPTGPKYRPSTLY